MSNIESVRKAAILVATLDRTVADMLLDQLDADQAQIIRNTILNMEVVNEAEERQAMREFLNAGQGPAACSAPQDAPRSPATTTPATARLRSHDFQASMDQASDRMIADCLCNELPQTIALALAQLPAHRASEIVAHLPASVQADVLERLVQLEPSSAVELTEVRDEFQAWLTQQLNRSMHRAELASRLATILEATSSPTRERILDNVASSDAMLARELRSRSAQASRQ